MSQFIPVVDEDVRTENGHFYAPAFQVRIDGQNLPKNVLRDVTELKYIDGLTEIDRFEITVNNWDSDTRDFKFIGSKLETPLSRLFFPCEKTVEVKFGYADHLLTMMLGNFTMMEPHFPASGAPTLTVTGLNVLHQLRRKKYTTAWPDKTPGEIAENIKTLKDQGKARFPLPIKASEDAKAGPKLDYTAQTNQYDVDFLLNLARQHGYELIVQEADTEKGTPRQLYFGPGATARAPVNYRLHWGRSLIEFQPTITSHNQVKSVTVNGWDRHAQKAIKETIDFSDKELKKLNADLREFVQCDPREELVVDRPVFTREQARDMARAILRDRASSVIKARGSTVGLPELRAGTRVFVDDLGPRLSGEYLVTKTEHSFTDAGYITHFEARREQIKGATG